MRRRFPIALAVFAALAFFAAACGDDGGTATTGTPAPGNTGDDSANDPSDPAETPQRIVSLSPSLTETLFAVGAGDRVVAVDEYSNYPADAPTTDLSGFTPNVEAIAKYEPDLVMLSDDLDGIVDKLETIGIKVLQLPAPTDIDGAYAQIEQVGAATGHVAEAAQVVLDMQTRIDEAISRVPETETPLTYYHELDSLLYSVTSKSFVGEIYGLFGLENIADPADAQGGGYPQLSAEFLVDANPDLVFLADTKCCAETVETFGARPGFDALDAVRNGAVVELDDDVASRWGPRIADFVEAVAEALVRLPDTAKAA